MVFADASIHIANCFYYMRCFLHVDGMMQLVIVEVLPANSCKPTIIKPKVQSYQVSQSYTSSKALAPTAVMRRSWRLATHVNTIQHRQHMHNTVLHCLLCPVCPMPGRTLVQTVLTAPQSEKASSTAVCSAVILSRSQQKRCFFTSSDQLSGPAICALQHSRPSTSHTPESQWQTAAVRSGMLQLQWKRSLPDWRQRQRMPSGLPSALPKTRGRRTSTWPSCWGRHARRSWAGPWPRSTVPTSKPRRPGPRCGSASLAHSPGGLAVARMQPTVEGKQSQGSKRPKSTVPWVGQRMPCFTCIAAAHPPQMRRELLGRREPAVRGSTLLAVVLRRTDGCAS